MPIPNFLESNRLKLYFKNSDLLQFEPCISLIINDFDDIPEDRFYEFLELLKGWFIKDVYLHTSNWDSLSKFEENLLGDFRIYIQPEKDTNKYLSKNMKESDELLAKRIFSAKDYYKSSSHHGQAVFNIYGDKAEIYSLKSHNKILKQSLQDCDSIEALYLSDGKKTVECTSALNYRSGMFIFRSKAIGNYKLLVIRGLRVQEIAGKLQYSLNFFNEKMFDSNAKEIEKKIKKYRKNIYGLLFDLDEILPIPEGEKLFIEDESLRDENLKHIAEFFFCSTSSKINYKNIIDIVYKNRLSSSFLAKLNRVFPLVKFFADAENSHILNTDFTTQTILKIDAEQFYYGTPYFEEVSINIRRTLSDRYAQDISDLNVAIHNIFNTKFSFYQKKYHIDYLFTLGVDKIVFNTKNILHILSNHSSNSISEVDPSYIGYSEWFYYLHQLGNLMKKGITQNDILIIYPSLDCDNDNFRIAVKELDRMGYSYELIKYENFENDIICSLDQGWINFNNKLFKMVLLPGLKRVSLKIVEKLHTFFKEGGIVVAIQQLPEFSTNKKDSSKINKLKKKIWLDEAEIKSTNFRQNENGGYGFYQPQISKLAEILLVLKEYIKLRIISDSDHLKYIVKETEKEIYIFITNLNDSESVPYTIRSKYLGKPFEWNFKTGESYAYGMWYMERDYLYINDKLSPHESRLFVLDKKSSLKTWQLKNRAFNNCKVLKQNPSTLKLKGWMREKGDVNLEIVRGEELIVQKINNAKVTPVLLINSKQWYVDSDTFQGKVNLGNFAVQAPYESHVLLYQKIIIINKEYLINQKLFLEIGKLLDWCSLFVNDEYVDQLLNPPWVFDITKFVNEGENKITIKVVNSLSNRLAEKDRHNRFPVREYGLFGPVKIVPYNIFYLKL
jgi:hypothetical protein